MQGLVGATAGVMRRGFLWWTGELRDLMPRRVLTARAPKTEATVLLGTSGGLRLLDGRRGAALKAEEPGAALEALLRMAKKRPNAPVALRVPLEICLERSVELPKAARRQARSILDLDLERATPFKPKDVLTAYTLEASPRKGWLTARQIVAKRKAIDRAVSELEALGLRVVHIDCAGPSGSAPLAMSAQTDAGPKTELSHRPRATLAILALALAASCVWIGISRREAALADLEARVQAERQRTAGNLKRAAQAQSQFKETRAILAFTNNRRRIAEIVDDLTKLLPDDVYLDSLTIDDGTVEITGMAKSAAAIVPLIERSSAFRDVESSAPITFDGTAQKEHFSYKMKVRGEVTSAAVDNGTGEVATP